MLDGFGRSIDYLRISVTDRCNLRCVYCMPEEGVPWMPQESILRYEDILRLCQFFVSLGIVNFRLTGGEPLARKGLAALVAGIKAISGAKRVALTTNGVALAENLPALVGAGLDGLNLSLDTLDRERFSALTRRDLLPEVLRGLDAALAAPGLNLKLNCVAAWRGNIRSRCASSSRCPSDWGEVSRPAPRKRCCERWNAPSALPNPALPRPAADRRGMSPFRDSQGKWALSAR